MTYPEQLQEYLANMGKHIPLDLISERCKTALVELAYQWHTRQDDHSFYYYTDLYLFDLTMYCQLHEQRGWFDWYKQKLQEIKPDKMLDFGGGIGEYSIIAAQLGIGDITYCDIGGSQTWNYAEYRFKKSGFKIKMMGEIPPQTKSFPERYDLIVAMDVLEHLENPQEWLKSMSFATKWLIIGRDIPFNTFYPQHISCPRPEEFFTQVDKDLWLSRNFDK